MQVAENCPNYGVGGRVPNSAQVWHSRGKFTASLDIKKKKKKSTSIL